MTLPKLPAPIPLGYDCNDDMIEGYMEEEMLAFQRETVEACASIVENADTPDCGGWTALGIAEAIRSMK